MEASIPRRPRPADAEGPASGDAAKKPTTQPSLLSSMAPPPPEATSSQSQQQQAKKQQQNRAPSASGLLSTPPSTHHPTTPTTLESSKKSTASSTTDALEMSSQPTKNNPALNAIENRAIKHLDDLIEKVSASLEPNTSLEQLINRDFKSKKGDMVSVCFVLVFIVLTLFDKLILQ